MLRYYLMLGLFFSVSTILSAQPVAQAFQNLEGISTKRPPSYAPIIKAVKPAVVSIYAMRMERSRSLQDPFLGLFFGLPDREGFMRERVERSLGSGVIVRDDGIILTNHHIVHRAKEVKVILADKREFEVEVLAEDPTSDLAMLKIKGKKETFPFLELANSDTLEQGDLVLAIGNPFGLSHTVTSGIVSAVSRAHPAGLKGQTYIQTDATINPGNSGGALVTLDNRLAGICTFILSKSGGSEGIGFVIPANALKPLLASLEHGGKIVRPWTGLSVQTIDQALAESLGLKQPGGVLIKKVEEDSPAKKAGLVSGDALLTMDSLPILDDAFFTSRISSSLVGSAIVFEVYKKDGKIEKATLNLASPPEKPARDLYKLTQRNHPLAGGSFVNISPAVVAELQLPLPSQGVVVSAIEQGSPAEAVGLLVGDVILIVNKESIKNTQDLRKQLHHPQRVWQFVIKRGGSTLSLVFSH